MPDQDPWEEAAKNFKPQPGAAASASTPTGSGGNDDWKLWQQGAQSNTQQPQQSTLQKIGSTISNLATGAGKGLASTIHSGGDMLRNIPGMKSVDDAYWHMLGKPAPSEEQWQQFTSPQGTAQSIGKGVEQAAEFMIPGAGEEKAGQLAANLAPKIARFTKPLAKAGMAALGSGTVNALQGGSFGTGAAIGGFGSGIGFWN